MNMVAIIFWMSVTAIVIIGVGVILNVIQDLLVDNSLK